jgi:hypothetical protein
MFLAGAGLTAYGIWEQKNVFGDQYFAAGRIVGYVPYNVSHGMIRAANRLAGLQNAVVSVTLDSGEVRQLKVHTPISYGINGKNYPELHIGKEISVTYFGKDPKEAFLVDHPLAEKPVKCSTFLMIGLALVGTVIVVGACSIWIARNF